MEKGAQEFCVCVHVFVCVHVLTENKRRRDTGHGVPKQQGLPERGRGPGHRTLGGRRTEAALFTQGCGGQLR